MSIWADLRRSFSRLDPPPLSPHEVRTRAAVASRPARLERAQTQLRTVGSQSVFPDWDTQVLMALGITGQPWRAPSINEALGVPAIFRAVSLIAQTTGSLPVEGYQNGNLLAYPDTPRLITRPDPFRTPREFYRD